MSIELDTLGDRIAETPPSSPAVPGLADATPILRNSTSPSGSHIPLRIQSDRTEGQASVEAANGDVDESHTADKSIFDLLKECIPKGSSSVLERVVHNRPSYTRVQLKSDSDSMKPDNWRPEAVWAQIDRLKSSEHGVLLIENINVEWSKALCKRYPNAINRRFVVEHVLGLDRMARRPPSAMRHRVFEDEKIVLRSIVADLERLDRIFPYLSDRIHERFGGHVDCWLASEDADLRIAPLRGCRFSLGTSDRVKINRFLSYCQLKENFCKSSFLKATGYL